MNYQIVLTLSWLAVLLPSKKLMSWDLFKRNILRRQCLQLATVQTMSRWSNQQMLVSALLEKRANKLLKPLISQSDSSDSSRDYWLSMVESPTEEIVFSSYTCSTRMLYMLLLVISGLVLSLHGQDKPCTILSSTSFITYLWPLCQSFGSLCTIMLKEKGIKWLSKFLCLLHPVTARFKKEINNWNYYKMQKNAKKMIRMLMNSNKIQNFMSWVSKDSATLSGSS